MNLAITKDAPKEKVRADKMNFDDFIEWAFREMAVAAAYGGETRARDTITFIAESAANSLVFGSKRELTCTDHPSYEGKNKPKKNCPECEAIWILKNSEKIKYKGY